MIELIYVDLFCGAGGTSTGVENAKVNGKKCAKVIAGINHDKNAISSNAANNPNVLYFTEDIRTLELSPLIQQVEKYRKLYPNALVVMWASVECTNFSKAKGGMPRDADSRTLAEHLYRYIEAINPDYLQVENVEEFMSWGDMDENGHPISMEKGKCYLKWIRTIKKYGYDYDHRILNAADYGAYTTRKRFFGIFAKHGLPIVFPEPTYCKEGKKDMFGELKKWKPVKEVLDFSDEGESIFGRKKPLIEKTLERIYAGLIKFVAGGKDAFMIKYNSMSKAGNYQAPSIDEPCPVVTTQNRLGVAKINFLSKQYSGNPAGKNIHVTGPAGTITTVDHHAFISAHYGHGYNRDTNSPAGTVTTKDRFELVSPRFIDQQYGKSKPITIDSPVGCLTTNPKYNLISPWIMNTNFSNVGSSINEPAQTITANRKWHYLMNPQFSSAGGSVDKPCFTLIARMDKMPPYLVATKTGEIAIKIFDTDKDEVVIDPVAGSGTTLLAAAQCGRKAYGFEIKKNFYKEANEKVLSKIQKNLFE